MENLTMYSPAFFNNNGTLEPSMIETNVSEYVKFSDIKELLQTSHNKQIMPVCPHYESQTIVAREGVSVDVCKCMGKPAYVERTLYAIEAQ